MNHRTTILAFALSLLPAAYLRAAPAPEREITAQAFVLVDAGGTRRATLSTEADGSTAFALLGADGKPRFRVGVGKDGVGFVVTDVAGNARAGLVASENATSFTLTDPVSGNTRVMLAAERGGNATVGLHDRTGEPRTTLTVGAAGKKSP